MNGWSLRGISRNRLDLSHGRDRDFFPRIDIADAALTAGNRKAFRRLEERCRSITSARLSSDDSLNEAGKNRARLIDRFEKRIDGRSRARHARRGTLEKHTSGRKLESVKTDRGLARARYRSRTINLARIHRSVSYLYRDC